MWEESLRPSALLVLARVSLSLPEGYVKKGYLIANEGAGGRVGGGVDERVETIYSFIGEYAPTQDTDCTKQETIHNIHDPAEVYRQSLQNAFVRSGEEAAEASLKPKQASGCEVR